MSPRSFVPAFFLAGAAVALAPTGLSGQAVPVANAVTLCPSADRGPGWYLFCENPDVATLSTGGFAVASDWDFEKVENGLFVLLSYGCTVDLLDGAGSPQGSRLLEEGWELPRSFDDYRPYGSFIASDAAGGLVTAWSVQEHYSTSVHARSLGPNGETRWEIMDRFPTTASDQWVSDVAANADGRSVVVWEEYPIRLAAQAFDAEGRSASRVVFIAVATTNWFRSHSPQVGMDRDGRFVVVWLEPERSVLGQRFGRDGRRLGAPFQIGLAGTKPPVLAMRPDGSFVVGWSEPGLSGQHLMLQWFGREGVPSGLAREVAPGAIPLSVAADRHGNIALLSDEGQAARLRLFNRDLVPQGSPREFPLNEMRRAASVALADSGRLVVAWPGPGQESVPDDTYVSPLLSQVWQARHNADPCVVRAGRFLCDTAGNGGAAEASIAFGRPGDIPLLGDWDGDGRADPCVYREGRFLCDTTHDGGAAETRTPRLGVPGDRPLLADVNGDGRADACLRRGRSFLCDRDRNGTLETRIDFGKTSDVPLLADVNGDHRADPCVERAGLYLCDTAHNGAAAEVVFDLNPALAGIGSGVPLLGDVDGDGRADPCLWSDGRLICGFFSRQGGVPASVLDLSFGRPGDVPVLGDLDAF